jgi:hypothetical protein
VNIGSGAQLPPERYACLVSNEADPSKDLDLDLLEFLGSLTPAERMRRHESALQLVLALRKAAMKHYGFDPRAVATPERREG